MLILQSILHPEMMITSLKNIILSGGSISDEQVLALADYAGNPELREAAKEITEKLTSSAFDSCSIINARSDVVEKTANGARSRRITTLIVTFTTLSMKTNVCGLRKSTKTPVCIGFRWLHQARQREVSPWIRFALCCGESRMKWVFSLARRSDSCPPMNYKSYGMPACVDTTATSKRLPNFSPHCAPPIRPKIRFKPYLPPRK